MSKSDPAESVRAEPNYDEMSEEQLETLLRGEELPEPEPESEPPQEDQAADDNTDPESAEEQAEEPVESEEARADEQPSEQDTPAESDKPSVEDDLPEWVRLRLEETEARAKKWESMVGRFTGELGYLRSQLNKGAATAQQQQARPSSDWGDEPNEPSAPNPPQPSGQTPDGYKDFLVQLAVKQAQAEFSSRYQDITEHQEAMSKYFQNSGMDATAVMNEIQSDPVTAQRTVSRLLEEAYWHAKTEAKTAARKEAEIRRAEQVAQMANLKKKATVSSSGSAPPPKAKPKTYDEMTVEELEAEIRKEMGSSYIG